jgi:hypothetical protein
LACMAATTKTGGSAVIMWPSGISSPKSSGCILEPFVINFLLSLIVEDRFGDQVAVWLNSLKQYPVQFCIHF